MLLHKFSKVPMLRASFILSIKSQVVLTYKYPTLFTRVKLTMYDSTGHVISSTFGVFLVEVCSLGKSLTIFGKGPTDPAAPYTPNRVTIVNPHTTIHQR
jgi:hypothetical protein